MIAKKVDLTGGVKSNITFRKFDILSSQENVQLYQITTH